MQGRVDGSRRSEIAASIVDGKMTPRAAAARFGVSATTARRCAMEERHRRRNAGFELMHAEGLSPLTCYSYGCRCETCRAAKAAASAKSIARMRDAERSARIDRLMAKAAEPIRELYIHGLGTLTVTPSGERIVKVVE